MKRFPERVPFPEHQMIHQKFDKDGKDQGDGIVDNQARQSLGIMDVHLVFADPGEPDDEPPSSVQFQGRYDSDRPADDIRNGCRQIYLLIELLPDQIPAH